MKEPPLTPAEILSITCSVNFAKDEAKNPSPLGQLMAIGVALESISKNLGIPFDFSNVICQATTEIREDGIKWGKTLGAINQAMTTNHNA